MSSRSENRNPAPKPAVTARASEGSRSDLPSRNIVTVLSVSASESDHHSLGQFFSRTKWVLLKSNSYQEAVALLRGKPVPVVLCDQALSDGSWKDLLDEIASLPAPPVLIVTSRLADDHLWAEVMSCGGYDVLEKPFNQSELVRVISLAWLSWNDQWQRSQGPQKTRAANDF